MKIENPLFYIDYSDHEIGIGEASLSESPILIKDHISVFHAKASDAITQAKSKFEEIESSTNIAAQLSIPLSLANISKLKLDTADKLAEELSELSEIEVDNLGVLLLDQKSGQLFTPGSSEKQDLLAVSYNQNALQEKLSEFEKEGLKIQEVYIRALNSIGAIRQLLAKDESLGPVGYVDIQAPNSYLFLLANEQMSNSEKLDQGLNSMMQVVMKSLGLKFPGSAAKLFYDGLYDFNDIKDELITPLQEGFNNVLPLYKNLAPKSLLCSGLPASKYALFDSLATKLSIESLTVNNEVAFASDSLKSHFSPSYIGLIYLLNHFRSKENLSWNIDLLSNVDKWKEQLPSIVNAKVSSAPSPEKKEKSKKTLEPSKPQLIAAAEAEAQVQEASSAPEPKEETAPKAPAPDPNSQSQVIEQAPEEEEKNKKPLIFAAIGALLLILILAIVFSGGNDEVAEKDSVQSTQQSEVAAIAAVSSKEKAASQTSLSSTSQASAAKAEAPVVEEKENEASIDDILAQIRKEEEERQKQQKGGLLISTVQDNVEVILDGESIGYTPLDMDSIKPGSYELELRKDGYVSYKKKIQVFENELLPLNNISLDLIPGVVEVTTEPEGIDVMIYPVTSSNPKVDAIRGVTPMIFDKIKPGHYKVVLSKPDWEDQVETIEVLSNKTHKIKKVFSSGSIEITSKPEGASVFFKNKFRGKTPLVLENIPRGPARFRVTLEGYEPEEFQVRIRKNRKSAKYIQMLSYDRIVGIDELTRIPEVDKSIAQINLPTKYAGRTGKVTFQCLVDKKGTPSEIKVIQSDIPALDDMVIDTVSKWQFIPGERKGHPVKTRIQMEIQFRDTNKTMDEEESEPAEVQRHGLF